MTPAEANVSALGMQRSQEPPQVLEGDLRQQLAVFSTGGRMSEGTGGGSELLLVMEVRLEGRWGES